MAVRSATKVRFDAYEVDLRTQELYKGERKVKLQVQPFQILAMLLEQPGELVTREEMQKRLWPADTFVDFEHSLNTAVKKLRQALGDDKTKPRFIETLPKRGYRFIGSVKGPLPPFAAPRQPAAGVSAKSVRPQPLIGRVAKLSCEKGVSLTLAAVDKESAAERQKLDAADDDVGLSLLIAAQKLLMLADGTPVRILDVEEALARCEARILEGEHYGKTALLPLNLLGEAPELRNIKGPREWNLAV